MSGHEATLAETKRVLRRQMAAARDGLTPDQRGRLSSLVCSYAWNWLQKEGAASFMAYASFRSELDTRPLIGKAWEQHMEVFLPRVHVPSGLMSVHRVDSWNELTPGAYGIPEPLDATATAEPEAPGPVPDVIFVPGLAFDRRGGRLGYGRGYYDRLRAAWEPALAGLKKAPVWAGVAYGIQLLEEVPMEEHDACMDILITEHGVVHCREEDEG